MQNPETAAISKMERFVIIVNGWKSLIIIIKSSILDVAAVLDPPLISGSEEGHIYFKKPSAKSCRFVKFVWTSATTRH